MPLIWMNCSRVLRVYAPVFIPVFERDGDVYAVHIKPGQSWELSPWLELPHDAAEPVLVASEMKFLPGGLISPRFWNVLRLDDIWDAILMLAATIPGAPTLSREMFENELSFPAQRAAIDPHDTAALLSEALEKAP